MVIVKKTLQDTKRPDDAKEAHSYLKTLPKSWVKHVKEQLATTLPEF